MVSITSIITCIFTYKKYANSLTHKNDSDNAVSLFFFVVLIMTFFRLDTRCTYDCIGTSAMQCLQKLKAKQFLKETFCLIFEQELFATGCKPVEQVPLDHQISRETVSERKERWSWAG